MKINIKVIAIIVIFFLILNFNLTYSSKDLVEKFQNKDSCPNLLIRKGRELHLINTNKTMVPGVNPIKFENLEEYVEFIKWQKQNNQNCPVLYFQESYNTQGKKSFRLLDDPVDPNPGLNVTPELPEQEITPLTDAGRDNQPYNKNQYAGFDPTDRDIGNRTKLDTMEDNITVSANPMSKKWGGHFTTLNAVRNGDFKGRTRSIEKNLMETANLN